MSDSYVRSIQGETLDMICAREYADVARGLKAVLDANPSLRHVGAVLPIGMIVQVPVLPLAADPPQIRLWS